MCIIHGRMNDGVNQIRISQCRFIKIDFIDFWALDCDTIAPWAVFLLLFGQCGNWLVRQKESLCFDHSSSDWINWMSVSSIGFLFLCFFYISWFSLSFFHRSFLSWNMWIKKFYPHFLRISNWFQTIESIFAEPNKWKKIYILWFSVIFMDIHSFFTFVPFHVFFLSLRALIWN